MNEHALLFPGQGAQTIGMGRALAEAFPVARETFRAANAALGFELDRLCFEGPIEDLSRSDNAQPAILTASVAALRALERACAPLPPPAGGAGLSLGEYTALTAAGAIEFEQAVRLVRARGRFMQEACEAAPGAMYSIIGLEDSLVEQACDEARRETGAGVWPANYNSPGQLVISGEEQPAMLAAQKCTETGARRAIRLKVAGAFHCPLMRPAARKLRAELALVDLRRPAFPVVANVTGLPAREPDEIRDLLVRQVTEPVRWVQCVRWLIGRRVGQFYEVGPGRVLQGLLRRIDPSKRCATVNDAEAVKACARAAQPG